MKTQTPLTPSKVGFLSAKYSFIIGTILFLVHQFSPIGPLYAFGLLYVIIAFIYNSLVLLLLLLNLIYPSEQRLKILMAIGAMLLNIPICFLYLHFI